MDVSIRLALVFETCANLLFVLSEWMAQFYLPCLSPSTWAVEQAVKRFTGKPTMKRFRMHCTLCIRCESIFHRFIRIMNTRCIRICEFVEWLTEHAFDLGFCAFVRDNTPSTIANWIVSDQYLPKKFMLMASVHKSKFHLVHFTFNLSPLNGCFCRISTDTIFI